MSFTCVKICAVYSWILFYLNTDDYSRSLLLRNVITLNSTTDSARVRGLYCDLIGI